MVIILIIKETVVAKEIRRTDNPSMTTNNIMCV